MAFLAPEPQAPLARNERETLAPRKWAFPPTLFMREWRSLRLNRKRRSRATNGRHLPLESGRSHQHYKVLFMREWRSLRLNRKSSSRATRRHSQVKNGLPSLLLMHDRRSMRLICKRLARNELQALVGQKSAFPFLCTKGVPCA